MSRRYGLHRDGRGLLLGRPGDSHLQGETIMDGETVGHLTQYLSLVAAVGGGAAPQPARKRAARARRIRKVVFLIVDL